MNLFIQGRFKFENKIPESDAERYEPFGVNYNTGNF